MDYIDFALTIGPRLAENQYRVSARTPSLGEAYGTFAQPLNDEQLELFVLKVGLARRTVRRIHSPEWRAAQDFGQKLFRGLFTEDIRAAFLSSHNDAVRQGKGLRLKLTLDAPELANYPWEFLYDPSSSQFLALFEDTPIIRYLELTRPILPLAVTPPLSILAVASSPRDYEPLDLARERRNLSEALKELVAAGLVRLDWLAAATLDDLREQLLRQPYHIFHFIGHGGFDADAQDGILAFENSDQRANRVSGERLAVILGNHRTLRLATLNACEGARTSQQDPFAGAAITLVRTGNLPAVVAMQFEISDNAAINFAKGFYGALAAGKPVDAAVGQGRQAIFVNDNDVEWSTPVLYLRASDGEIFDIDRARADATGTPVRQTEAVIPPRVEPTKTAEPLPAAVEARSDKPPSGTQKPVEKATLSAPAAAVATESLLARPLLYKLGLADLMLAVAAAMSAAAGIAIFLANSGEYTPGLGTFALFPGMAIAGGAAGWFTAQALRLSAPLNRKQVLTLVLGWGAALVVGSLFFHYPEGDNLESLFSAVVLGGTLAWVLWQSRICVDKLWLGGIFLGFIVGFFILLLPPLPAGVYGFFEGVVASSLDTVETSQQYMLKFGMTGLVFGLVGGVIALGVLYAYLRRRATP